METWSIHTNRNTGKIETVDYLGDGMETYEINRPNVRHWVAHAIKLEDALLIAAAPELLAAVESLVGRFGGSSVCALDTKALHEARVAIAKARPV